MPPPHPDAFFLALDDEDVPDADLGGKGASLRRLATAGLPTPPGFVIADALYRLLAADPLTAPFPPGFLEALAGRLAALATPRFSVRSSFAHEDRPGEVAAGIYESRTDVAADDVPAAIRAVLQSAGAPAARAYAAARNADAGAPPIAVLIHPFIAGDSQGGAAGAPGRPSLIDVHESLDPTARATIEAALHTLVARFGAVELEWVAAGTQVTFLQLRPFTPPPPAPAWPGFADLSPDSAEERARWTWDAAHNPLPLSRAHAGLVALVDAATEIGIRQRVMGGYLFWAPAPDRAPRPSHEPPAVTFAVLADAVARDLRALPEPPALEAALALFVRHYQALLGEVQATTRQARGALAAFLSAELPDAQPSVLLADVESQEKIRRRLAERLASATTSEAREQARAAYLAVFGDEANAWDVAAPTHREQPHALRGMSAAPPLSSWQGTLAALTARLAPAEARAFPTLVVHARQAVATGEDDDWLYARLQAVVRRALLALGARLVAAGALDDVDQVFDLPLATLRALATSEVPAPATLRAEAARGRAFTAAARLTPPPLPAAARAPVGALRGVGCGGRVLGRVVLRHGPQGTHPPPDAVLVATSLLPTELPLLQVAALVVETGGPLGHVATQARERGLPAVVGAAGALALLRDGDQVLVDGDAGLVMKTGG